MMRLKIDENVHPEAAERLAASGHVEAGARTSPRAGS